MPDDHTTAENSGQLIEGETVPMPTPAHMQRKQRANEYMEAEREWYSDKANDYKKTARRYTFVLISSGALIAFIQVLALTFSSWGIYWTVLTGCIGLAIGIIKGLESHQQNSGTWQGYRQASEAMKRERRLYIYAAGSYDLVDDEEQRFRRFVENIEEIIADEHAGFWTARENNGQNKAH